MKRILTVIALLFCVLAAGAQTTTITSSNIAFPRTGRVTGLMCLTPTDASGNPVTLTTSGAPTFTAGAIQCFPVTSGVLGTASVPDLSLASPSNACYQATVYNGAATGYVGPGAQVGSYPCLHPSGSTWNFDPDPYSGSTSAGTGGGSLSQKVVYASKLAGVTGGVAVVPGSSATSTTDSATALNAAIASGNVDLEVDSGYALSTSLVLASNTTIHCIAPQYGFIMQTASNASVLVNANQNSPTTSSGTGGFLPSNITDTNIKVQGCTLNANSTQAVTGTNSASTAHGATPGGKFTYGAFFLGVNGLTLDGNECYDSGAWCIFTSNILYERITNNWVHQPTPTVASKFTDGIHTIGPKQFFWTQNNRINAGDDSIADNADDGNRTGSGDANASYVQAAVKWGPITDGHIDNNSFDATSFGLRLYSATELIDRISVTNTSGVVCGNAGIINALAALGTGNFGKIDIDGWTVQTTGTCNTFSIPYNFQVTGCPTAVNLDHVKMSNPAVTWPIWQETCATPGIRSFRDWDLDTQSSGFSNLIVLNGGSGGQMALSGINWWDAAGTGSVVSGTAALNSLTCSNYVGPNRLLAGGFAPTNQNGDCFTNVYTTTYISTTFNEASSGNLAGTTPAVTTAAAAWTASSGGPSGTGSWQYSTNSVTLSGACTSGGADNFCPVFINTGCPSTSNCVSRFNVTKFEPATAAVTGLGFVVRWTNNSNFVTFLANGSSQTTQTWGLYDVVAGTTTQIGSSVVLGAASGVWTVTMNGTSAKLTNPGGTSMSGTISGSNTSANVGMSSNYTTFVGGQTDVLNAFSVKSN